MDRIHVMELVRSFQVGEIDRRTFLKRTTAAIGSLAAANTLLAACAAFPNEEAPPVIDESQPAAAPGMETEGDLTVGIVEYPDTDDETLMGYLAYPSSGEAVPAIIVIQEWWGLNDHIMDVANRLAHEGYVTLAPDLYHGQVATEPDEARKLVMELDMPAAVREIGQAIAYLLDQDYVSGDKVGIMGFCMGGGLVLQTALVNESLAVAIPFYGSPLSAEDAGKVTAPVLGLYGGADQGIPADAVKKMEEGLQAAGIPNQIIIYDGAPHAFFNDTRDSYTPAAAEDAWPRVLQWLNTYLRS